MAKKNKKKRYCSHCQHKDYLIAKLESQLQETQAQLIALKSN